MTTRNPREGVDVSFRHLRGRAVGEGAIHSLERLMTLAIVARTIIVLAGLAVCWWR